MTRGKLDLSSLSLLQEVVCLTESILFTLNLLSMTYLSTVALSFLAVSREGAAIRLRVSECIQRHHSILLPLN